MSDHYDTLLTGMRENLAFAKKQAAGGDFMAEHEAEQIELAIAETEREAAVYRAKTPEQLAAEDAAREAKRAEEHRRGVEAGWWEEDGTPIDQLEDEEEED